MPLDAEEGNVKLLPFNSFIKGAFVTCPKCTHGHAVHEEAGPDTMFCDIDHGAHVTKADAGHLHRTCRRCGFEWIERTADTT